MSSFMKSENTLMNTHESKHYNMKQFICAARDFGNTRTEETANLINRHLQLLSVTIDLSIFDPHSSIVCEFFVSLHALLSNLELRSSLAWCCVNVLKTSCGNSAARNVLIHTYEFIPPLSRLLGDHLPIEKKVKLLTLMQELTCGIRLSWQIPHLRHLMLTLTKWINSEVGQNDDLVSISLGVLVNLCYKNVPALYTLTKCVDIKSFIRTVSTLEGVGIEVHACKLLIILDEMQGKIPFESLIKLTEVTFKTMIEAFKAKNSILLRHIIEFFLDVKMHDGRRNFPIHYTQLDSEVDKLLDTIDSNPKCAGDAIEHDPECISVALLFLHSLLELKSSKLAPFYERLVKISLQWLQVEAVSTHALIMLQTICSQDFGGEILECSLNVNNSVSFLLVELEHKTEDIPTNLEYNKKLSALMQLLLSLLKINSLRDKILHVVEPQHLYKIFAPLLGDGQLSRARANDVNTSSTEAVNLYVISLALIHELSKHSEDWKKIYSLLIEQKQMHLVLAQGFYGGSTAIRSLLLGLSSSDSFPRDPVAAALVEIQPVIELGGKNEDKTHADIVDSFYIPTMTVSQSAKMEEILEKLRIAVSNQNGLLNSATSDVMELYEYKLASMGHAERAAMASMEAASHRCTQLQHRIAQLTAELSRTHQLLFHSQQCQGDLNKEKDFLQEKLKELTNMWEGERGRTKAISSQLSVKEKILEETSKKLKEIETEKAGLEEHNTVFKATITRLELNLGKVEKACKKKDESLKITNSNVEQLKNQIQYLENQVLQTESQLSTTANQLVEVKRELTVKKQIIDTITKLAVNNT